MEQSVVIYNQGQEIFGNFHLPYEGAPGIVMSHGFGSSKDGNKWRVLSPRFYDIGFASLRFSYSGCGEGEERSEGEFEDTTLTRRVSDYKVAIDFLYQTRIEPTRLGAIGSSLGGMVALAARDDRIKAMVTLATPASSLLPSQEELKDVREKGYFELESGGRLRVEFYDDLCQYNILDEVEKIHCPLLIIHGSLDEVIPVEHAYKLYSHANEPKRLEVIEGGNHALDRPGNLEKIINLSLEWFKAYL